MYITFTFASAKQGRTHSETQSICHQKSKTGEPVAPRKNMCPPKTCFKKVIVVFSVCRSSLARMDFSALRPLSEEESSAERGEDKENQPPAAPTSTPGHKHNNISSKRLGTVQTLSVQYATRQSLSIRVPKAKVDRSTQVRVYQICLLVFCSAIHTFLTALQKE